MSRLTAASLLNRLLVRGKFRHLQVILQLAELGSLRRAAESIGMTQSAVTQTLGYVEALLETPLFIRHARGVMATQACLELLPTVRQLMLGVAQGAEVLSAAREQGRQSLRLLASGSAIRGLLVTTLGDFVDKHPDIRLELTEAEGEDQLLSVARKETDLVVCRQPATIPVGWEFVPLMPDRLVVVAGPDDPFAQAGALSWGQLQDRRWLISSVHTQARQQFELLCAAWPRQPDYFPVTTRVLPVAAQLIRSHQLLGFLPYSFVQQLLEDRRLLALPVTGRFSLAPVGLLRPVLQARASALAFASFLIARVPTYREPPAA
jgi:DNA-binding transcriptional LysR family regulator